MFYKIDNNDILSVQGEFNVVGVFNQEIFITSNKKLPKPFVLIDALPETLEKQQEIILKQEKEKKIQELNAYCDDLLKSFESDALGELHIYDANLEDQINLMGLVIAGIDSFFRCNKKDEIKQNIPHTKEQLQKVYQDGLLHKSKIIEKCGVLKALVENAKTQSEVQEIFWDGDHNE